MICCCSTGEKLAQEIKQRAVEQVNEIQRNLKMNNKCNGIDRKKHLENIINKIHK